MLRQRKLVTMWITLGPRANSFIKLINEISGIKNVDARGLIRPGSVLVTILVLPATLTVNKLFKRCCKMSMDREPCPYRIVEDAGNAFMFGLVGSSIWNTVGGIRNAPSGHRIAQAISRIKARAPLTAGGFAVWGILYSLCDCTIASIRQKEGPLNAILSGAATGGILAIRGGYKLAAKNALLGGAILAVIEGLQIGISKMLMPYIEERSKQNGESISDLLCPPVDILYQRGGTRNAEPMFQPLPVYSSNNDDFGHDDNDKWSSKSS